jgi:hypothetical protein
MRVRQLRGVPVNADRSSVDTRSPYGPTAHFVSAGPSAAFGPAPRRRAVAFFFGAVAFGAAAFGRADVVGAGFLATVFFGLAAAAFFGLPAAAFFGLRAVVFFGLAAAAFFGLPAAVFFGLAAVLFFGLRAVVFFGLAEAVFFGLAAVVFFGLDDGVFFISAPSCCEAGRPAIDSRCAARTPEHTARRWRSGSQTLGGMDARRTMGP